MKDGGEWKIVAYHNAIGVSATVKTDFFLLDVPLQRV